MSSTAQKQEGGVAELDQAIIRDKIILIHHSMPTSKKKVGPTVNLFFHELSKLQPASLKKISKISGWILLLPLAVLYPFVALLKLKHAGPAITTQKCTGFRGRSFNRYIFNIDHSNTDEPIQKQSPVDRFLRYTKLYELPSCINLIKGQMNIVGPKVLPAQTNEHWNLKLSDYYKKFCVSPGLKGVAEVDPFNYAPDIESAQKLLRKEFSYLQRPHLGKSLKILFGIQ